MQVQENYYLLAEDIIKKAAKDLKSTSTKDRETAKIFFNSDWCKLLFIELNLNYKLFMQRIEKFF